MDELEALGAVGGVVNDLNNLVIEADMGAKRKTKNANVADRIAENAQSQLEENLMRLRTLELEKEDIEAKMKTNEDDLQNYLRRKKESNKQESIAMTDCLMAISRQEEEQRKCDLEMKNLVTLMNELKMKKDDVANNLKILKRKKTKLEKSADKSKEEFKTEASRIQFEKNNLQDALQTKIQAIENLTRPDISQNSIRIHGILERSIHEKEKSINDKEKELECPVCLEIAQVPIFMCEEQHVICSGCRMSDKVDKCPMCRVEYTGKPRRHRFAEKILEEVTRMREEVSRLKEEQGQLDHN